VAQPEGSVSKSLRYIYIRLQTSHLSVLALTRVAHIQDTTVTIQTEIFHIPMHQKKAQWHSDTEYCAKWCSGCLRNWIC
jgi:hypothetical protein